MQDFKVKSWIFYTLVTFLTCSIAPLSAVLFIDDLWIWNLDEYSDIGFWYEFWFLISKDFYVFISVIPVSIFFNNVHNYFKNKPFSFVPNKSVGVYLYLAYCVYAFDVAPIKEEGLWYLAFFVPLFLLIPYYFISFYYAPDKNIDKDSNNEA